MAAGKSKKKSGPQRIYTDGEQVLYRPASRSRTDQRLAHIVTIVGPPQRPYGRLRYTIRTNAGDRGQVGATTLEPLPAPRSDTKKGN